MTERCNSLRSTTLLSALSIGLYLIAAGLVIALVNAHVKEQALLEAEAKARMLLDRNLATHAYFSTTLKPRLFEWTAPFRSTDYFEPSWMSSTYAIRTAHRFFSELSNAGYYYKDAAINARSPENEADADEKAFLLDVNADPNLVIRQGVRTREGVPYLVVMRRGEVMEPACLQCHGDPADAPADLAREYGDVRSFGRQVGEVISVVSIRVPLAVAYAEAERITWQLSGLLLLPLGALFAIHFGLTRRWVLTPVIRLRDQARLIASAEQHLGEQVPLPFGRELCELTAAFNVLSTSLHDHREHLETRVHDRTVELTTANAQLQREIGERKLAEAQLQYMAADLQRSNADLERFAYVASHDLQEPLRMVTSFLQLLKGRLDGQLDEDADEFIGFAVDGARRMQLLINALLDYSRIGTQGAPLNPIDANTVMTDALWNLNLAITDAGADVTYDRLPTVLADPTQLTQLFQNLIGNAIKFRGAEPPCVHVSARALGSAEGGGEPGAWTAGGAEGQPTRPSTSSATESPLSPQAGFWLFSVRDNGIGIDPKDQSQIFGIFQRLHTRTEYPGTGIGLAVCQRIVERHGGRIWVESTPGEGSTFYFTLLASS